MHSNPITTTPDFRALLTAPDNGPGSANLALRSAGGKLHLVAESGPWALWLPEDGTTASLLHDQADDLGAGWARALTDLAALLGDSRIADVIQNNIRR